MKNQQLKALVQVAESGSIRAAARVMNLCQSALTKSLRELEEEVGAELLLRSYKGIEFTDAGHILLTRARLALSLLDKAQEEIALQQGGAGVRVSIAVTPLVGIRVLPQVLLKFERIHTAPRINLSEGFLTTLIPQLIDGRLDFAVALADLTEGTEVTFNNQSVTLRQAVGRGHKFALIPIAKGENVVKYGLPIGHALADIAPGEHIHSHNTRTNLSDLDAYSYQPDLSEPAAQPADRDIQIYRRANGEVGVRNELWILPTVGCVNGIARQIQNRFLKETNEAEGTDGVFLFSHTYGCSQLGDDHINTRTMLQNMVRHPNAGAVLVIGLGCENNQVDAFRDTLGEFDPERVHFMVCQHQDDEVEAGVEQLHQLYEVMRHDKRQPGKLSELKFGLECGGSDGLSGITANPMLGRFSDYVIANGGTTVLTEVPEMFGAERILMSHCRDEETFEKTVTCFK